MMKAGKVGARMRCQRCHGLMVVDSFMDLADDTGHLWLRAWRCVNCGVVVDPGITRHRFAQRSRFARLVERLTRRAHSSPEVVPIGV